MRWLPVAVVALAMALPAAGASASQPPGPAEAPSVPQAGAGPACARAPCGYIRPTLELVFPGATPCFEPASECLRLPGVGETLRLEGTVRWGWDITRDGTYPADSAQPIVISFSPGQKNPSWLAMAVEPETYTLTAAELNDPRGMRPGPDPATPTLFYVYERPLNLTLTRTGGEPGPGVVETLLKAQSSPSGAYFTASFAVKLIGLATDAPSGHAQEAAGLPLAAAAVALVAGAGWRRKR